MTKKTRRIDLDAPDSTGGTRIEPAASRETPRERLRRTSRNFADSITAANWIVGIILVVGGIAVGRSGSQLSGAFVGALSVILLAYIAGALRQIIQILCDIHESHRP